MGRFRRIAAAALAGVAILAVPHRAALAQEAGTLTGKVIEEKAGTPIPDATVFVVGTTHGSTTKQDGSYRIAGIPAGAVQVRVTRIGYAAITQPVTIAVRGNVTLNFALRPTVAQLDQVIVNAAGGSERKRENGASVATVVVDSIPKAAVQNFSDVLTGRVAGVTVEHSGGTTGTGSSVRIRGSNSIDLSNEPLYYVDGIRQDNNPASFTIGVGGQSPSRIDEIDQEEIDDIEVVKGPAASALYGTAAANGVVLITTKRGAAGKPRWNAYAEGGVVSEFSRFPANYGLWTQSYDPLPGITSNPTCTLYFVAAGDCVADSLAMYNPLEQSSPFRTGNRSKIGLGVSGGSDAMSYYLGGNVEGENGIYTVSALDRFGLRGNLHANLTDKLDVTVSTGFVNSNLRLPQNDDNYIGPIPDGLGGWPYRESLDAYGHPTYGYNPIGLDQMFDFVDKQHLAHFTGGLTANWRPLDWLSFTAITGADYINQFDEETVPPNTTFTLDFPLGRRTANRVVTGTYTTNVSGTATYHFTGTLAGATTLGSQYVASQIANQTGFGKPLAFGTGSLSGVVGGFIVGEQSVEDKLFGGYVSQQVSWNDRLFLTGALRGDNSSAFGTSLGTVYYPAASASWVISEEPFFPKGGTISSLRLRTAVGKSGLQPRALDAVSYYNPVAARVAGQEQGAITIGNLGDPNLKPESSREWEGGFDLGLFGDRVSFEATYYDKHSDNALVEQAIAGSAGSATALLRNIGAVSNKGIEVLVSAGIVRQDRLDWDISLSAWGNKNRLLSLGAGIPPIIINDEQRHVVGYPLGGFWAIPLDSVKDLNHDGMIGPDEVFWNPNGTYKFIGSAIPTKGAAFSTNVALFKRVRLAATLEYRGGYYQFNNSEQFRCAFYTCAADALMSSSLKDKADAAAAIQSNSTYTYGYIEDASFVKLREISAELIAPQRWARLINAGTLSLTFGVRNLATWTKYRGVDPEADSSTQDNFQRFEFFSQPQVRYYVFRLNATY